MVKKWSVTIRPERFYEKHYLLMHLGYLLFVFFPQARIGIFSTLLTALYLLGLKINLSKKSSVFLIFVMFWSMFSIVFLQSGNQTLSIVFTKFASAIFPMIFFFVGQESDKLGRSAFFRYLQYSLYLCFFIGLYWYFSEPTYFLDYMKRTDAGFLYTTYLMNKRFWSYTGSISAGLLSVCGIIYFLCQYYETKHFHYIFGFLCMLVMSALSMQRSSYILTAFFVLNIIVRHQKYSIKSTLQIILILLFLAGSVYFLPLENSNLLYQIKTRFSHINIISMFNRSETWMQLSHLGIGILTGSGLGSYTQGAVYTINDGAYFNIIGEIGLIGFTLWLLVIFISLQSYYKSRRENLIEELIVAAFLLNAIGSNTILYMDMAPLFWYSLGCLSSGDS